MSQSAVVTTYTHLLESWNRRAASAFAALFTDEGSSVGFDGSQMNGRGAIEATLREIFGSHPTASYVAKVREVRPLGADVTLLRAVVGMVPPGSNELNPAVNAIQSLVMVGHGDSTRIAHLHNTPAAFHGRPDAARALTAELADLVRRGVTVSEP